ncbi:MAG: HIT family protein [Planctomycetota bacterium]|nr:HIT family protein [Planctomycetota bacterium]
MPSIFDKILSGELSCHRVYEDAHTLAFLDIAPLAPGHTLVIPKEAREHLHQLSDESAAALGLALPRVARAVLAATGAKHYNVLQNNGESAHQAVPHVHFHVIPRLKEKGLGLQWNSGKLEDAEELLERMHTALATEEDPSL